MIIEGHDLLDKYRRLRILYNRVGVFGKTTFYSYWFKHVFHTALGDRMFVCTLPFINTPDEKMEFYYFNGHNELKENILFVIEINRNYYKFISSKVTEEQAWLAIHELEELSYRELELHETV